MCAALFYWHKGDPDRYFILSPNAVFPTYIVKTVISSYIKCTAEDEITFILSELRDRFSAVMQ